MEPTPKTWCWFRWIFTPDWHAGGCFDLEIVDLRPGLAVLQVSGQKASEIFQNEAGGHRWQHAPTGRVHTSTITVAVLEEPTQTELVIHPKDLDIATCRGSGNGGQHRNKTDSAVIVTHLPTKTVVRCENERSQHKNRALAIQTLRARIWHSMQEKTAQAHCEARNSQIGSGMRGDKRRTIQAQNNVVKDHLTGRKWRYQDYLEGKWN